MTLVIWPEIPDHEVAAIREAAGAMEVVAPKNEAEAREAAPRGGGVDREADAGTAGARAAPALESSRRRSAWRASSSPTSSPATWC